MEIYVARPGDSLYSAARRYGTDTEALRYVNQLSDPSRLTAGQSLVIPAEAEPERRSIEIGACVYPSAGGSVQNESMSYFTYLCPFSCHADINGNLRSIDDEMLVRTAEAHQTAPMLTVTNIGENGGFSGEIAHAVLTREETRSRLLENIILRLRAGKYYGVIVNFEYIYPFDRDSYSRFIAEVSDRLHLLGYTVFAAAAPKECAEQSGMLCAAHDYEALGRSADRVILMTYEWGHTYGAPQAVSPADRIREVLDYAVTAIPAGRILLGFSNYGYDWTLPWKQGDAARLISGSAAADLAVSAQAEIRYDGGAQSPYFRYTDPAGKRHVVWFDDARSVRARLRLVEEYGLAGISIWTADKLYRPALHVLQSMFSAEKLL